MTVKIEPMLDKVNPKGVTTVSVNCKEFWLETNNCQCTYTLNRWYL